VIFGFRCPSCRGQWGWIAMYSGSLISIRKGLMLCPYCGVELDTPLPSAGENTSSDCRRRQESSPISCRTASITSTKALFQSMESSGWLVMALTLRFAYFLFFLSTSLDDRYCW